MSRISSSSFKVNSNLEQLVSVTNTLLDVSDASAQSSLQSIDTSTASSVVSLQNIDTSTSGCDISLQNIDATNSSIVSNTASISSGISSVASNTANIPSQGQATKSASLPVVIASDQGALSVTFSSSNSGSEGNLDNNQSKISGDFSTEVDVSAGNNLQISGITSDTSMNPIEIWIAHSSAGTKYKYGYEIYPDSNGYFSEKISQTAINYLCLKYSVSATVTATVLFN